MASGPTTLFTLASGLLDAVDTGFAFYGVALPDLQYVTAAQPVALCNSVAVGWTAINQGWPGQPVPQTGFDLGSTTVAMLTVSIFRCLTAAESTNPTAAMLTADAQTVMTDAFVLFRTCMKMTKQQPPWFGDYATAMQLGPLGAIPAEGGMGGVMMDLIVELD